MSRRDGIFVLLILRATVMLWGCGSDGGAEGAEDTGQATDGGATDGDSDAAPDEDSGAAPGEDAGDVADADAEEEAWEVVDERAPCARRDLRRDVYFGDLHVHTAYSFDAQVFEVRNDPAAAYRFARGEALTLPPLDASGVGTQRVQLERPLDFAAVTDHSEYFAEVESCLDEGSAAYATRTCQDFREGGQDSIFFWGFGLTASEPRRIADICRPGVVNCPELAQDVWVRIQQAAEAAYDRTEACGFTSFVAYEYSNATGISNQHRNVIFRSAQVPARATSYFDEATPQGLWDSLGRDCLDAGDGCNVLAIPHNSNWSNGNLFHVEYPGAAGLDEERAQAARRAALEPLVEVYQHKGDSECMNGLGTLAGAPDELCDFEKLRRGPFEDCGDGTGTGAMGGIGCLSRVDFLRGALQEGLVEEARLGVNPYRLGVIASTDTHNGTPGAVSEEDFKGHWGNNEDTATRRLGYGELTPSGVIFSAGGLAAVWAEENSREAIFDALRRRETYGTSGPRLAVRLFGGWGYPDDLCADPDAIAVADDGGVPMGGVLEAAPAGGAPRFFIQALRDPGTASRPAVGLERVQVIKGWLEADGAPRERVYEVAGDPALGAGVDLATCARTGPEGAASLCALWTDPDFDPAQRAFYYARVLEAPTCRWSTWQCNALAPNARPESCSDPEVPKTVRERAWTSPIWYSP